MILKTASSFEPNEKFVPIGQSKAKGILKSIKNHSTRIKLKPTAVKIGTGRISLLKLTKRISAFGPLATDKFVRAARTYLNKGINPDIQKVYIKEGMQRDETGIKNKQMYNIKYAGGNVRTKGIKEDLNVGGGIKTGFAQNYKSDKLPNNSAPKEPMAGTRPMDL